MIKKIKYLLPTLILLSLLSGCKDYIKFEITRYFSGFFITLIIGVVGLIIVALLGGGKK